MKGFSTKAIHGVQLKKDVHGSLRTPVYDCVAFEYESARDIQLAFEGKKPGHAYSRISNPTIEDFEQRVRLISGALGVIAVSSGMAAISDVIIALAESGSNIICTKNIAWDSVKNSSVFSAPYVLSTDRFRISRQRPESIVT